MRTQPSTPPTPAPCHFCGEPSTRVMGIRPVCERCAPVVAELNQRNLHRMLAFFREAAVRQEQTEKAA